MCRLLANVEFFVIKDLVKLAESLEVDTLSILHLINSELLAKRKTRKK
jgi:hypothetical protein